jgi:hypothetical protein
MTLRQAVHMGCLVLFLAPTSGPAAQTAGAAVANDLRVDWNAKPGVRPAIEGYVVNEGGWWYKTIRLSVEAIDAGGATVGRTIVTVPGDLPPGGRTYFDAALPAPGASYRVGFLSMDRLGGGTSQT